MNLGKAIKLCRTQRNLTQSGLANMAGISVSYLSLLERGKRYPNFYTVEEIAKALDVPLIILIFFASNNEELSELGTELSEKLSYIALRLIEESNGEIQ